jgi:hypothetical protein
VGRCPVRARDSLSYCPVGVRVFLVVLFQSELDVLSSIVQLGLVVHCHATQLELDVYIVNRSIMV